MNNKCNGKPCSPFEYVKFLKNGPGPLPGFRFAQTQMKAEP